MKTKYTVTTLFPNIYIYIAAEIILISEKICIISFECDISAYTIGHRQPDDGLWYRPKYRIRKK